MSLSVINLGYFLIGVFLFLIIKFVDRLDYFQDTELIQHRIAKVWNFIFGLGCILVLINGFFTLVQVFVAVHVIDYLEIVPLILFIVVIPIFLMDSFKAPTKNYLLALGLGTAIASIGFVMGLILAFVGVENLVGQYVRYINYILLIPFLLTSIIGVVIGTVIYYGYLKTKKEKWNDALWDISEIHDKLNNKYLLLGLSIVVFFEIFFQWQSMSLLSLFIQVI
ncbi:MAG: hypothetical protein ACTSRW_07815 [Candidatus Helarchaeota archaeon]